MKDMNHRDPPFEILSQARESYFGSVLTARKKRVPTIAADITVYGSQRHGQRPAADCSIADRGRGRGTRAGTS